MAKRTGKGSGKPAPPIVYSGADLADTPLSLADLKKKAAIPYSPDLFEEICLRLERGESLTSICKRDGYPHIGSIYDWMERHPPLAERYARARLVQSRTMASEIIDILDTDPDPVRARNRAWGRQWLASKMNPKELGDRIEVDHNVNTQFAEQVKKARNRASKSKR